MHGRQELIAITKVVLAELTGGIAERLEQICDGWVFRLKAQSGTRHADFGQTGAERILASNESSTPGGAALLAVVVGEGATLVGHAIDVGSVITHHAAAEETDVPRADVITPQDQNVRFFRCHDCPSSLGIFVAVELSVRCPASEL